YALPESRVHLQQPPYVLIGVLVVGVEAGQKGMEAPALLLVKLLQGVGQNVIGATVPVGAGIIAGIVAWAAGFILVPFLGYRNAADHHVADVMGIHLLEQLVHALAFLEEVHVMQVGVGIDILPGLGNQAEQPGEQVHKTTVKAGQGG